jgi:hypothetical protein
MANHKQAQTFQGVTYGTAVVRLSHTDLTAAALTETVTLDALRVAHPDGQAGVVPANARIMYAYVNLITPFSGGTVATCVVDVGDTAIPSELIAAHNVFTGATLGPGTTAGAYTLGALEADYTGDGAAVVVTTTVGNVADLTAGAAEICIIYQALTSDALT